MSKKTTGGNRIPLGSKPADKSGAWRALSPQAKAALMMYRRSGDFGGTPNQAPYWSAQEYGEPGAQIEALHYIAQALAEWRTQVPGMISRWIKG